MANEIRQRQNFLGGLVEDNPLTATATTLTSASLAAMVAVDATSHIPIILDPDGVYGDPEIAWVTSHAVSATTATIVRGAESSFARQHNAGIPWLHGPTTFDLGVNTLSSIPAIASPAWKVQGDASFISGGAQLTPAAGSMTGMVWYSVPVKADGLVLTWTQVLGIDGVGVYLHSSASDPTNGLVIGPSASVTWYTYYANPTPSGATGGCAICSATGGTQQYVDDSKISQSASNTAVTNFYTMIVKKLAGNQYQIDTARQGQTFLRAIQPLPTPLVYLGFRGFTGGSYAAQSITAFSGSQAV